jgi:protein unc-79
MQENLLIPRLWSLLRSDFSHVRHSLGNLLYCKVPFCLKVGQMAVPLVLHAITLPLGDDVFWDNVNREFTSPEWECRLKAGDH